MEPTGDGKVLSINTLDASGNSIIHVGDSTQRTEHTVGRDKFDYISRFSQVNHYNFGVGQTPSATPDPYAGLPYPTLPLRPGSAPLVENNLDQPETAVHSPETYTPNPSADWHAIESRDTANGVTDWDCLSREDLILHIIKGSRVLLVGTLLTPAELRQNLNTQRTPVLRREAEAIHIARRCIEARDSITRSPSRPTHAYDIRFPASSSSSTPELSSKDSIDTEQERPVKVTTPASAADAKPLDAELQATFTRILEAMQWDIWFTYAGHRPPDEPPTAFELQWLMKDLSAAQRALSTEIDGAREIV